MGVRCVGPELEGGANELGRLGVAPLLIAQYAEEMLGIEVRRVRLENLLIDFRRLIEPALLVQTARLPEKLGTIVCCCCHLVPRVPMGGPAADCSSAARL